MAGLRCLCILFVSMIVVVVGQETIHVASSRGASGIQCARTGRRCLYGLRCIRTAGRCECNPGDKGDAEFECVPNTQNVCLITGDPVVRVQGFGGASERVDYPCTFRATRFITRKDVRTYCSVEVHVTSEAYGDTFRTRAVHVSVGLTDPTNQIQRNVETIVTGSYGHNDTDSYSYTIRTTPMDVFTYGSASFSQDNQRGDQNLIITSLDDVNNLAVLNIPDCETKVKFRGYDTTVSSTQPLLPGIAVVVPRTAEFFEGYGTYPYSLCGRPRDGTGLYTTYNRNVGYGNVQASIIASALHQRSPQFDNPLSLQCQTAISVFDKSTDKPSDIKACSFLLNKKNLRGCLQNKGIEPLDVFNACLQHRQSANDVNACTTLQLATSRCGNMWSGSRNYCAN